MNFYYYFRFKIYLFSIKYLKSITYKSILFLKFYLNFYFNVDNIVNNFQKIDKMHPFKGVHFVFDKISNFKILNDILLKNVLLFFFEAYNLFLDNLRGLAY